MGHHAEGPLSVFVPPVDRTEQGDFELRISDEEREVLRGIPGRLGELLDGERRGDPAMERLFPAAYPDDAGMNAEYVQMVDGELMSNRRAAVAMMERTIDNNTLTEEEALSWLTTINDVRLVLGTRLELTEESTEEDFANDDANSQAFALYAYLTFLEDHVVRALAEE